ncbi:hypothetical protein D8M09_02265 [Enterobacter sp. R1(2018)]|nr:hypothetical protein D8M09_02265 [Enterobacter sp. R1(2018)]
MRYIKKMLLWLWRQLFSLYGPPLCIIIFAVLQGYFFPAGPIWPVGLFAIFIVFIFARYVK